MPARTRAALAALRAQPWCILPEYLDAIEALAERALEADVLEILARDGHAERHQANLEAVASVGTRLEGARLATVRDGTAVIPVFGPIFPRANLVNSSAGGTSLDAIMADLRAAQGSTAVERIVMLYDSPGGVVSGLGEAASAIATSPKPITGFVTGMAASAAYWLASRAAELILEPAAQVGSIGVVDLVVRQEAPGQDGCRAYEVVSSGAPNKRPDPTSEEGRAALQAKVDAIESVFVASVAEGRGKSSDYVKRNFGRGAMVPAAQAVEAGMADRIATLEATLNGLARRAGPTPPSRRASAEREFDLRQRRAN